MLIVVKYGGNAMGGVRGDLADPVLCELAARSRAGDTVVLVHGGGPQIDAALSARNIRTERIAGQRVTSAATLEVTEAVLCGTVNKALVRALLSLDAKAVGICGQDGSLLQAARLDLRLGFVGRVNQVAPGVLEALLERGYLPVVAPLGYDPAEGTALNVNADAAAGALAAALRADLYLNVTNVDRVRLEASDPATAVASLEETAIVAGFARGAFDGGMRPKLESALLALAGGAKRAVITGAGAGSIAAALKGAGTEVLLA